MVRRCVRWGALVLLVSLFMPTAVDGHEGRWKIGGPGECYWDAYDSGPDQCSPNQPVAPTGRWKLGDGCYWDATDSGPNQCEPQVNGVTETEAYRLARAAQTMVALGIDPNNFVTHDLPVVLYALETEGYQFAVSSAQARELVTEYYGIGGRNSCDYNKQRAAALDQMQIAFTEVAWLYGGGYGILRLIGAIPPIQSAVIVGGAVAGVAGTVAGWLAREYRNAPCVA